MKLNIVTDYHLFAPNALGSLQDFEDKVSQVIKGGEFLYSIGDNFDLANCKKKELESARGYRRDFYNRMQVYHIDGNHERISCVNDYAHPHSAVMLTHGDFEFWGKKKAVEYRSKPQGAGFLKRGIVVNMIEAFEKGFESKINSDFLKAASRRASQAGFHTYICGHKHPDETFETKFGGVRIIVLKRGFNVVDV